MIDFFIAWLFDLARKDGFKHVRNILQGDELSRNIRKEIKKWTEELPPIIYLNEDALFPTSEKYKELKDSQYLLKLKQNLNDKEIPPIELWQEAFYELWRYKKRILGKDAQPFFQKELQEIVPHIIQLSEALFKICSEDEKFFRGTMARDFLSPEKINEASAIIDKYLRNLINNGHLKEALKNINRIRKLDNIDKMPALKNVLIIVESDILIKIQDREEYKSQIAALESISPSFDKYYFLLILNKHFDKKLKITDFIKLYKISKYSKELKYYYSLRWEEKDIYPELALTSFDEKAYDKLARQKLVYYINHSQNEKGKKFAKENTMYFETPETIFATKIIEMNAITHGKHTNNLSISDIQRLNDLYKQFEKFEFIFIEANKDLLQYFHYNFAILCSYLKNENWLLHFNYFKDDTKLVLRFIGFLIIIQVHDYINIIIEVNPDLKKNKKVANQLIKFYYITNQHDKLLEFKSSKYSVDDEFQIYIDLVETIKTANNKKGRFSESDLVNLKQNASIPIFNITIANIFHFHKLDEEAKKYIENAKSLEEQFNEMEWDQYFALCMKIEDDFEVERVYKKISEENPYIIISYIKFLMRNNKIMLENSEKLNELFSIKHKYINDEPDLIRLKTQYYYFVGEKDKAIKILQELATKYDCDIDWFNVTLFIVENGETEKLNDIEARLESKQKTSTIFLALSLCTLYKEGLGIETRLETFSKYLFNFFLSVFPEQILLNDTLIPPIDLEIVLNGYHVKYDKKIVNTNTFLTLKKINTSDELLICLHSTRDFAVPIEDDYMEAKHIYFESDDALKLQYKTVGEKVNILGENYNISHIDSLWNYPGYFLNKLILRNPQKFGFTQVEIKNDPIVDSFSIMYENEQRNKEIITKYNQGIYPVFLMTSGNYDRYAGLFLQLLIEKNYILKAGVGFDITKYKKFILSYSSIILLHIFGKLETIKNEIIVISKSTMQELKILYKKYKIKPEEDKLSIALDKDYLPVSYVSDSKKNINKIQTWKKMLKFLSKATIIDTVNIDDKLAPYVKVIGKLEIDALRVAKEINFPVIIDDNTVQQYSKLIQIEQVSNLIPFYFNFSSDSLLEKLSFIEQLSQLQYRFIIYPGFIENCVTRILKESHVILGENTVLSKFLIIMKNEINLDYPSNINVIGFVNGLKYLISHYLDSNSEKILVELLKILEKNTRNELKNVLIQEYILHSDYKAFVNACFKQIT